MTLKMGSRSPKSNQFFFMSKSNQFFFMSVMCRRNLLSSEQWILHHVLKFQLRLAPHHTRRVCLCRSVRNGRLIGHRDFRPAACSLLLMVLLGTRRPAPQCNCRNGAVVIGVRLARQTKALSSLGVVLHGLSCLGRSLTCPVSACFLKSLLTIV